MQGWVNGSLRSADRTLAHFGVKPMDGPQCEDPSEDTATTAAKRRVPKLWGG